MAKARHRRSPRSTRAKVRSRGGDDRARVISVALAFAAEGRWRDMRMSDLAARADVPLATLHRLFPTREAIVDAFIRDIDAAMTSSGSYAPDDPSPARDRLFDIVMRRIDAMTPHKAAVRTLMANASCDPYAGLCVVFRLSRSLALMLEAAGLSNAGATGVLRIKGLSLIWLNTVRTWLDDNSADLAKTMAALDKGLRRAEKAVGFVTGRRPRAKPA